MQKMTKLEYKVRFVTPAFLGNAEQNGQWRTPPFKALLRQWWRVACGITDVERLRQKEGRLFGVASDDGGDSHKSAVRVRLGSWAPGTFCGAWGNDPKVFHSEVGERGRSVGSHLYMGYGPIVYKRGTVLKANAAIQAGETNTLRIAVPDSVDAVADAFQLIQWFGTLGGRSRNGWGSLSLEHQSIHRGFPAREQFQSGHLLHRIARPLADCLQLDWSHALGASTDGRVLVWQSAQTFTDWREAMQVLAKAKIGFRTEFPLHGGGQFQQRHLLAYPVTHHSVGRWGGQSRLANQLRFKVAENGDGRLSAYIFHIPCALPQPLSQALGDNAPTVRQQVSIWQQVHAWLDNTPVSGFQRI